jgi:putative signal transducing protein
MDSELVLLHVCQNIHQAYLLRSALEGSGVEAFIADEYGSTYPPIGILGVRLLVHAHDLDRARAILDTVNRETGE